MAEKRPTRYLGVRITEELDDRLEAAAERRGLKKPDIVRWLLSKVGEVDKVRPGVVVEQEDS